jgi:hypothetical protein
VLLLLISWVAAKIIRGTTQPSAGGFQVRLIRLSVWLGFFIFMGKVGINQCPRYLAAYYPFLAASFLLAASHGKLVRRIWWQWCGLAVIAISLGLIVLSRQRPLFPAQTISKLLAEHAGSKPFLRKLVNSYTFAESLRAELKPFLAKIPPGEPKIGYAVRAGDKEPWLWKPFFHREIKRVLNSDPPEAVRALGIRYVVVDRSALTPIYDPAMVAELPSPRSNIQSIEEWVRIYNAEEVASGDVRVEPDAPPEKIYLVRLRAN